jgi:hypothetical protein
MGKLAACAVLALVVALPAGAAVPTPSRTLDGSGNNLLHPDWGKAGMPYLRVAPANYSDGIGTPVTGPNARWVSNRIFNDLGTNLFSENGLSQLDWTWGQFMDHTFGLRDQTPAGDISIPFDPSDPLESFSSDFPIGVSRTPAAGSSGSTTTRQQTNTVMSFIGGWNVYGGTLDRQEWLRDGLYDGNMANNDAQLVLINGYLPRESARGSDVPAPHMDTMGPLVGHDDRAVVAGDVRANENIALTALHTLFAREHNRIASMVPQTLSEETRFQIARRVVGAEEQYITYTEFLPDMGITLPAYTGYDQTVNPTLSNEFATVGYRAHSQIHGEMEPTAKAGRYSDTQLQKFQSQGIVVTPSADGTEVKLTIPLSLTFGNPSLLTQVGLAPLLKGLAAERQYKNDEQIDNQLRSILFQVPKPGTDPAQCVGAPDPACYSAVVDLGAIDIQRARDHGMPLYNDMRAAYGLPRLPTFEDITGEPPSPTIDPNDPATIQFLHLFDDEGVEVPLTDPSNAVVGVRGSTLAARLRAIYGTVDKVDAFVGMMCERHVPGTEFGPLQLAMWTKQFQALRDGDRFFYGNDAYLTTIQTKYGIDYRHTLGQIIELNTNAGVQADVFKALGD